MFTFGNSFLGLFRGADDWADVPAKVRFIPNALVCDCGISIKSEAVIGCSVSIIEPSDVTEPESFISVLF